MLSFTVVGFPPAGVTTGVKWTHLPPGNEPTWPVFFGVATGNIFYFKTPRGLCVGLLKEKILLRLEQKDAYSLAEGWVRKNRPGGSILNR